MSWNLLFLVLVLSHLVCLLSEDFPSRKPISWPKGLALREGIPRGPQDFLNGGRKISSSVAAAWPLMSMSFLSLTSRNTETQDVGKMRQRKRRRKRKQRKMVAPAAATLRAAKRRRRRKGWAGADVGRVEPGKPSWSGMTLPSPISAHVRAHPRVPFISPTPTSARVYHMSPLISRTGLGGSFPQHPGTHSLRLGHSPISQPWGGSQEPSVIVHGDFRVAFVLEPPLLLPWAHPASYQPICGFCLRSSLQGRMAAFRSLTYLGSTFPEPLGSSPLCTDLAQTGGFSLPYRQVVRFHRSEISVLSTSKEHPDKAELSLQGKVYQGWARAHPHARMLSAWRAFPFVLVFPLCPF